MRLSMLTRRTVFLLAAAISLVAIAVSIVPRWGVSSVSQAQAGFTNASLKGKYAFVTAGGSPAEATLGLLTSDGNGNITNATLRLNVPTSVLQPGATGRSVVPATGNGTYTVNADGTGTATATVNTAAGVLSRSFEFVISRADGSTATEVQLSQREPTLAGGLGFFALERLSN